MLRPRRAWALGSDRLDPYASAMSSLLASSSTKWHNFAELFFALVKWRQGCWRSSYLKRVGIRKALSSEDSWNGDHNSEVTGVEKKFAWGSSF